MRVNIYAEELTEKVEIVTKVSAEGAEFKGLRFILKTHEDMLPPRHPDDDSSGVTFWIRSRRTGFQDGDENSLRRLFDIALNRLS